MVSPTKATASNRNLSEENPSIAPPNTFLPNLSFLLTGPAAKRLNVGDNVGAAHTPITTNTTFLLSQLPALRAILTQLRPKLATLATATNPVGESNPKREERRQYIDSRTQLHLEKMGELGAAEVVRGRKVDEKEVQSLESVIGMLAK